MRKTIGCVVVMACVFQYIYFLQLRTQMIRLIRLKGFTFFVLCYYEVKLIDNFYICIYIFLIILGDTIKIIATLKLMFILFCCLLFHRDFYLKYVKRTSFSFLDAMNKYTFHMSETLILHLLYYSVFVIQRYLTLCHMLLLL